MHIFANHFVKDVDTSKDIVSDTFLSIWQNKKNIHIKSSLKSYLFFTVKNKSLNYLKRSQKVSYTDDFSYLDSTKYNIITPHSLLEEQEKIASIQKIIDQLPQKCKIIFLMNRDEEMSYKEIAEALEISINTVKTQIYRALKVLKRELKKVNSFK